MFAGSFSGGSIWEFLTCFFGGWYDFALSGIASHTFTVEPFSFHKPRAVVPRGSQACWTVGYDGQMYDGQEDRLLDKKHQKTKKTGWNLWELWEVWCKFFCHEKLGEDSTIYIKYELLVEK